MSSYLGKIFWENVETEIYDNNLSFNELQQELNVTGVDRQYVRNARKNKTVPQRKDVLDVMLHYLDCDLWVLFMENKKENEK